MTDRDLPVTEDELHVYVDGELAADRREAVERWLATHPDDAARVAAWRAQAEAVRAHYGAIVNEPVPEHLTLAKITRNRRSWAAAAAAAVIAAFAIGGVAGWMVRGASAEAPSKFETFTNEALGAHRLYIAEVRHPIEVNASENHLLPWLSRRVGTNLRAPDLSSFGLRLLGGRLLPGISGPAALFMYESTGGERVTLYASRQAEPQTSFRYNVANQFGAVHWVENDIGYVMSGPADKDRLKSIARLAYEQMENRAPLRERTDATQMMSRRGS
jgi:anti-sigma factor RsiW